MNTIAWLIEKEDSKNKGCVTGFCLGECGRKGNLVWGTPNSAIRFSRKEDAESVARGLKLKSTIATEHGFGAVEMDLVSYYDKKSLEVFDD